MQVIKEKKKKGKPYDLFYNENVERNLIWKIKVNWE